GLCLHLLPRYLQVRNLAALRTHVKDTVTALLTSWDFHEDIYSNRIDICNPGEPIVPTERFIDSYRSRNERLADISRRMGICEEKGSGIDKVIQTVEVYQLPAPSFLSADMR